jgi:uncharacterized iron-regulated membrane protein
MVQPGSQTTERVGPALRGLRGGYEQYSGLAKTVSHGIALHEGRHLGVVSMVLSAAMCLGILFLCVTGPLLWWRRRPRGAARLGAPRARMPPRATPVLAAG